MRSRRITEARLQLAEAVKQHAQRQANFLAKVDGWLASLDEAGPKRVLVVDDDGVIRSLARASLQGIGVEVDEAAGFEVAVEMLRSRSYDLVVLDLSLPNGDGLDLIGRIRCAGRKRLASIIVISGYVPPEPLSIIAERTGAAVWLTKPFSMAELAAAVRRVLGLDTEAVSV